MANKDLTRAKKNKNDEFFTQLPDIENELKHYKQHFKDKTVFCNCDDPEYSNFWQYFSLNFEHLQLKRLLATHYEDTKQSYMLEMWRDKNGVHTDIRTLRQNGDFRSPECIDLLKQADVVVTNPPFSMFREYVAQLMEYDKKFIIIGNQNAVTFKEFYPLIKDNKVWFGASIHSGDREFRIPDNYPITASGFRIDDDGTKYIRVKGVRWYTNLDYPERHEDLILYKNYTPEEFPKYDNYDAINIDKTADIPYDYNGAMGVPITFLDKYNPDQFEVLDAREYAKNDKQKNKNTYLVKDADGAINGKAKYVRILIRKKAQQK